MCYLLMREIFICLTCWCADVKMLSIQLTADFVDRIGNHETCFWFLSHFSDIKSCVHFYCCRELYLTQCDVMGIGQASLTCMCSAELACQGSVCIATLEAGDAQKRFFPVLVKISQYWFMRHISDDCQYVGPINFLKPCCSWLAILRKVQ